MCSAKFFNRDKIVKITDDTLNNFKFIKEGKMFKKFKSNF
jgi:hypothetical protein